MRNLLQFVLCLFVFIAPAESQTGLTPEAPFRIERGTSFAASTGRTVLPTDHREMSPAERITVDVRLALDVIRANHVSGADINPFSAMKSSISSMLAELDPHSVYLDAVEFSKLLGEHQSEYSGTGSTIASFIKERRFETYVLNTQPGSAAARANLQYGDRILAVGGTKVSGLTADVVRDKIRGPSGTIVRVTVERAASGQTETVEMRRDRIPQPSISNYCVVGNGVGYIALSNGFTHTTVPELNIALSELHRRGAKSLILDLRGNSGGILGQAAGVAERFLPSGDVIMSQRGRSRLNDRVWSSRNRTPERLPLVVLVNEQTASASEIVAGALKDNGRALIVGQNTFGKGLVQDVIELPMGGGLALTTGRYFSPSGRSIQRNYDGRGRYDYFMRRSSSNSDDTPTSETRMISAPQVNGGYGITPDVYAVREGYNVKRASLVDPIFFFVREVFSGKLALGRDHALSSKDVIRQSVIFGADSLSDETFRLFRVFVRDGPFYVDTKLIDKEIDFIRTQLRYQLTLAAFGVQAAETVLIESDTQISRAIEAIPRAAASARDFAQRQQANQRKKPTGSHSRRVRVETGGIRKTVRR